MTTMNSPISPVRKDPDGTIPETVPLVTRPPLARLETEIEMDEHDDRETINHPYPGVDDGLFPQNNSNPDSEEVPKSDGIPIIISRAGGDGDSEKPDEVDGGNRPNVNTLGSPGLFPYAPSFGGRDIEGSVVPDLDSIPDVNVYQHKKTLAQGMMDLALFSANANQLRYVLETFSQHPYYYPSLILISLSLIGQIAVGIGLIWNATYNVKDEKEICIANKINNFTVITIFLVTVINVFISAFGVANPVPTPTT